jgi:hypothetical protein
VSEGSKILHQKQLRFFYEFGKQYLSAGLTSDKIRFFYAQDLDKSSFSILPK